MDLRKFPGILKQKIMTRRGQAAEELNLGQIEGKDGDGTGKSLKPC
jgi:hypothetical protein